MTRVAVLGCGNWGTTIAIKLAGLGNEVRVWEYDSDRVERILRDGENADFLPGVALPPSVIVSNDSQFVLDQAELAIIVLPTPTIRSALQTMKTALIGVEVIVSASKGLEYETGARISEIIEEELGPDCPCVVALSGPNLAWEILRDQPSSAVAASRSAKAARVTQALFSSPTYRVYSSADVIGVEYGGALKNIIAIGAGIVHGLKFGDNTKGALMTRGLAEITRFGQVFGARPTTFLGLSGVGDLVTTCSSHLSRNHTTGRLLSSGKSLAAIQSELKMVAEGINTTRSVNRVALERDIPMPITQALFGIMFEGNDVGTTIADLMTRDLRGEDEFDALAKR